MKRVCFFLLRVLISLPAFSQLPTVKNNNLVYTAKINTDSGTVRGYLWHVSDSVIFLSLYKKLTTAGQPQQLIIFKAENIQSFTVKKRKMEWLYPVTGAVLGFIVGAGLTGNPDYDNNGETSFFELVASAIEGSTSRNRSRRKTALYVGMGAGLLGFGVGLFSDRKITIRLPLFNRKKGLQEQRTRIESFITNY